MTDTAGGPTDLLPNVKRNFNAKKLCTFSFFFWLKFFFECLKLKIILFLDIGKKAAFSIRAVTRMATLAHAEHDTGRAEMRDNVFRYKEESAKVCVGVCLLLNLRLIAFCLIFFLIFFFLRKTWRCVIFISTP